MSVKKCIIDYFIVMTCIYVCALLCIYHAKFHVPVYHNVICCKAARAQVHCPRYALEQILNYYYFAYISNLMQLFYGKYIHLNVSAISLLNIVSSRI